MNSPSPVEARAVNGLDTNRMRTTLVLLKGEIQKLKEYYYSVTTLDGKDFHLSSFVIASALVWTCLAKSVAAAGEVVSDDVPETFIFSANCRGRMLDTLHVPDNYFGNCLSIESAVLKHGELIGVNGFVMAVASIAKAIKDRLYGEKGILDRAEDWFKRISFAKPPVVIAAGSTKIDIYGADFGWGKPNKFELLCTDGRCFFSSSVSKV